VAVVVLSVSISIATTTLHIESKKAVGERLSTDRQRNRQTDRQTDNVSQETDARLGALI